MNALVVMYGQITQTHYKFRWKKKQNFTLSLHNRKLHWTYSEFKDTSTYQMSYGTTGAGTYGLMLSSGKKNLKEYEYIKCLTSTSTQQQPNGS